MTTGRSHIIIAIENGNETRLSARCGYRNGVMLHRCNVKCKRCHRGRAICDGGRRRARSKTSRVWPVDHGHWCGKEAERCDLHRSTMQRSATRREQMHMEFGKLSEIARSVPPLKTEKMLDNLTRRRENATWCARIDDKRISLKTDMPIQQR
jgi:hypothetical protein